MNIIDIIKGMDPILWITIIVNIVSIVGIISIIKKIIARDQKEQKYKGNINETILDAFIKEQEDLALSGSGDDEVYSNQIKTYVNKQRKLWLALIEQLNNRNSMI